MKVEESVFMKVFMDGNGHIVTNAHYRSKSVGSQSQMRILAHSLKTLTFLLHGVIASTKAINGDLFTLDFNTLTSALTLDKFADYRQTGSGSYFFQQIFIKQIGIDYYLNIIDCRTIVKCNEVHCLATAVGSYPSFHVNGHSEVLTLENINHLYSTNFFHFYLFA